MSFPAHPAMNKNTLASPRGARPGYVPRLILIIIAVLAAFGVQAETLRAQSQKPKIIIITGGQNYKYTKLQSLALQMGLKCSFDGIPSDDCDAALIMTGWGDVFPRVISTGMLGVIDTYVKKGGRAALFVTTRIDLYNSFFADMHSVIISKEILKKADSLVLAGEKILPLWKGIIVGAKPVASAIRIGSYFSGDLSSGEVTYIKSEESDKNRAVSIVKRHGKGELILSQATFSGTFYNMDGWIFHDDQFEEFDNEEAARRLLNWLVHGTKTETKTGAKPTDSLPVEQKASGLRITRLVVADSPIDPTHKELIAADRPFYCFAYWFQPKGMDKVKVAFTIKEAGSGKTLHEMSIDRPRRGESD